MVSDDIEAIFAGQDPPDGDMDVEGIMVIYDHLRSTATREDVPTLVNALKSPRNNFWTRELLSEPICRLGGVDYLEPLFDAFEMSFEEGHDNDSFQMHLIELAHAEPERCRTALRRFLDRPDFKHIDSARWLLEFCDDTQQH